jgi:hypothetical protein
LVQLLKDAETIKFVKPKTEFEKEFCKKITTDFCKRIKFILFETGIHKSGINLFIGSIERENFESLFNSLKGRRKTKI